MNHNFLTMLLIAALFSMGGAHADTHPPNDPQDGESTCLDYYALFLVDDTYGSDVLDVEAGSDYIVQHGGSAIAIDWYDAAGKNIGIHHVNAGTVPAGAVYATICINPLVLPTLGLMGASYTYQDGW